MERKDFEEEVLDYANNRKPKSWRVGQAVFNYIDNQYGVARDVQFKENVDCFYDDKLIKDFLRLSYNRIRKKKGWQSLGGILEQA